MKVKLSDKQEYYIDRKEDEEGFRVFTKIPFIPAHCKNLHVKADFMSDDLQGGVYDYDVKITNGISFKKIVGNFDDVSFVDIELTILDGYLLNDLKANNGILENSYVDVPVMLKISVIPHDYESSYKEKLLNFVKKLYDNSKMYVDLDYINSNIVVELDNDRKLLRIYVDENY